MKRTYSPSKIKRKRKHGFLNKIKKKSKIKILKNRSNKLRKII